MKVTLNQYFKLTEKGTSISVEFLAGFSTFLSLSYIFVVNPAILAHAGMNKSAVLFATIVVSGLATLVMGLWTNYPFVLSSGMEMNAYVAFFAVGAMGFTWQQGLGAVFWSGVLCMILTLSRVREKIIYAIPDRMKSAVSLSVGIFLMLIALKIPGVLIYDKLALKGFGNIFSSQAMVLYAGIIMIYILEKLKVRTAVLISIIASAVLAHCLDIGTDSGDSIRLSSSMLSAFGQVDLGVIANPRILSVILVLFLVDFYGSIAKFIGLTYHTNIMEKGKLPRMKQALVVDSGATIAGSCLGSTSITTYVESGVGIGLGGRTGLSAVFCSLFMFATFLLVPLINYVPVVATTGALFFVGIKLFPSRQELKKFSKVDIACLTAMPIMVIATFSLERAMLVGFLVYLVIHSLQKKVNMYMVLSTVLLIVGVILQIN